MYPRALPLGLFALIAAITLMSVTAIERGETQRNAATLSTHVIATAAALERRANASSAYLRAGAALLSTMDEIPAADFRRFVSELRLDSSNRVGDGIGWAKVVRPGEEEAFDLLLAGGGDEQQGSVRENGETPRLNPRPTGEQPYAVPVTYLQPDTERNRRALGFDLYSEPVRRAAMIEAERGMRPTASGRVVLAQEISLDEHGFLIFMPVYEAGQRSQNGRGGRQLKGFIYSPFNARDFLNSALEMERPSDFGVHLYEGESAAPAKLMASTGAQAGGATASSPLMIAGHSYLLVVSQAAPSGLLGRGLSGLSLATLIFGLLVACLLMIVVRMLTQQAMENEATLAWFEEQASIRNSLTRELNHRVKNTLANVLSIIALTRRRATDVNDFANGLDGRIRALSATHDLLTQSDWGVTPVRAVIDAELLPYAHGGDHKVLIEGPDVELAPNDALSLGLAIHELATNAGKYGSLSTPGGSLSVTWTLISQTLLRVTWLERGGPPVSRQRARGFGTDLIERVVAHELGNPVELDFDVEGVRCQLCVAVRQPREFSLRAGG